MKYSRVFLNCVKHELVHGIRIIWNEHQNECLIALFIMLLHLICAVFFSAQEEARDGIFISFGFILLVLNSIVYLSQRRTLVFLYLYIFWIAFAIYCHKGPLFPGVLFCLVKHAKIAAYVTYFSL
jgi:hypothetical protein